MLGPLQTGVSCILVVLREAFSSNVNFTNINFYLLIPSREWWIQVFKKKLQKETYKPTFLLEPLSIIKTELIL